MSPEKEQVTVMILYVDLKCSCCYKKVRKLLCKFPQIRDQVFDEEKNKVTITVVCCDPERMRDKLCCKGGKAIQSIEILDPPKPKPQPPPPAPKPAADPPPKLPDPPQPKVPDNPKPPPQPKKPDPVPQPQPKMPDPPQPKVPDNPKPPPQPKLPDPPQPKVPDPKPPPQPKVPDPKPPPQPEKPDPVPPPPTQAARSTPTRASTHCNGSLLATGFSVLPRVLRRSRRRPLLLWLWKACTTATRPML
ncbi:putative heavy metal-associated domain superfamily [Helianthus annuus]|nr:putative heavy metal-associated domain superfamily [Helianthus annuus]